MKWIKTYGPAEKKPPRDFSKIPKLPNPWPPEDIETLITIAATTTGLASVAYKLIKLWVDDRGARGIKIKKGDVELELRGSSTKEIEKVFSHFRKLTRGKQGDVETTLPPNVDRSLPKQLKAENSKMNKRRGKK